MICPICGKSYETGRQLHGHLMRSHETEYKEAGYNKENLKPGSGGSKRNNTKPAGFRMLKMADPEEAQAYKAGYRFIDNEELVYSYEEAKGEGWI